MSLYGRVLMAVLELYTIISTLCLNSTGTLERKLWSDVIAVVGKCRYSAPAVCGY